MVYDRGLSSPFCCGNAIQLILCVLLILGTCGPIVLMMLASHGITVLLLGILVVLTLNADYAVAQVCLIAIAPTISHTVALRYNPVAYYCVVSLQSVIYYGVGLVGAGYVGSEMSRTDWMHACLECLGLLILSFVFILPVSLAGVGILIKAPTPPVPQPPQLVPAPVPALNVTADSDTNFALQSTSVEPAQCLRFVGDSERADDTHYQNLDANHDLESNWAQLGMRPMNWYDTRAMAGPDGLPYLYINSLQVFNLPGDLTTALHILVFVLGYGAGAVSLIYYFETTGSVADKWWKTYILIALLVSVMCFISFAVGFGLRLYGIVRVSKRVTLCLEVFAVFLMMLGIVLRSLAEGNLVNKFGV